MTGKQLWELATDPGLTNPEDTVAAIYALEHERVATHRSLILGASLAAVAGLVASGVTAGHVDPAVVVGGGVAFFVAAVAYVVTERRQHRLQAEMLIAIHLCALLGKHK